MCRGILWVHPDCRHRKKFETLPNGHCNVYATQADRLNHIDGHCNRHLVVDHVNWVDAPLLCVRCFREAEDQISVIFDGRIHAFEQDHANVVADLLIQTNPRNQRVREEQLEDLQREIDEIKLSRRNAIAAFRARQGVWADG